MKQITLLLLMITFCFSAMTGYAAVPVATTSTSTVSSAPSVVVKKNLAERIAAKAEKKISKFVSHLPIKKEEDSKFIIAILLGLILGGLGIHRVYLGGKKSLILFYLLLSFLFGLGALLALIDVIVMAIDGNTSKFDGNDKLFAAF
jgi:TM2 domain-containing membrane protein YozV